MYTNSLECYVRKHLIEQNLLSSHYSLVLLMLIYEWNGKQITYQRYLDFAPLLQAAIDDE